jgi:hypothetical protein
MVVQARTLEFYGQYGFADEMIEQGVVAGAAHLREGGDDGRVARSFRSASRTWGKA